LLNSDDLSIGHGGFFEFSLNLEFDRFVALGGEKELIVFVSGSTGSVPEFDENVLDRQSHFEGHIAFFGQKISVFFDGVHLIERK